MTMSGDNFKALISAYLVFCADRYEILSAGGSYYTDVTQQLCLRN